MAPYCKQRNVDSINPSTLRRFHYGPSTLTLFTVWGHHTYTVYIMALVNLRCLQYGPIQPFLQPDKHKPDSAGSIMKTT
jgi:hypothetical protein